jgi:CDP-glucose 4,6-dehydratase
MREPFEGIYKGKNVLVTGHTGFKGSWLSLWLHNLGAHVGGYSRKPPTEPNHFDSLRLPIHSVIGDIGTVDLLEKTFDEQRPEIVFHLAAQPLVRQAYRDPTETFQSNVMGTLQICEAARRCSSVRAIVAITTDKVYENREWEWGYRENDRLGGHDPYSSSKACAEILLSSYRRSYFPADSYGKSHRVLLASARAGNVIGGGDWSEDRLIPDLMKAAARKEKTAIRNPNATRPWQHVLECLSGYLQLGRKLLSEKAIYADAFNFGPHPDDSKTVAEIAALAKKYWPAVNFQFLTDPHQPHEAAKLNLDCAKARSMLQWQPIWNSETALQRTVRWYRAFYQEEQVLSAEDLQTYIHDAKKRGVPWA